MNALAKIALLILLIFGGMHVFGQTRKVEHYYNNDSTLLQETFFVDSNNIIQGEYKAYYANQKISRQGNYENNSPVGKWLFYYQNGQLKSEGEFVDGVANGDWKYYFENGNIRMKGPLVKNQKEGIWQHFYENGIIKNEGMYRNSLKEGNWKYYREDGAFKADGAFKRDEGIYIEYFENGNVKMSGKIVDGKSTGKWKYYHKNGFLKAEGQEEGGLKEADWKFYYETGELKSEGMYDHGKSDGEWKYYHKNGEIEAKGNQSGEEKIGYWNMFFPSGKPKAEANYDDEDGTYKEYYESGKLKVSGQFKKGNHDGLWLYFYEDGTREANCNYTNGVGIYKGYYNDGKVKMEGTLKNGEKTGDWKLFNKDGEVAGIYRTYEEKEGSFEKKFEIINDTSSVQRNKNVPHVLDEKDKPRGEKKRIKYPGMPVDHKIIVSTNPIAPLLGQLPLSVEYYTFNRYSHQVDFTYIKSPFLTAEKNIPFEEVYRSGFAIDYRFKNYQKININGRPFFGHEARYNVIWHTINIRDTVSDVLSLSERETRYEYSVLFGSRNFLKNINKHLTSEIFLGIGFGYRTIRKDWGDNVDYDQLFVAIDNRQFHIPIRLGLSVGYTF